MYGRSDKGGAKMNTVILTGRLAGEVEIRTFDSGKVKASFTLAVNREYNKEETDFLPCVIWGKCNPGWT